MPFLSLLLSLAAGVAPPEAARLEKACEGGDSQACVRAAERYETGLGVPRDPARGAGLRQLALPRRSSSPSCGPSQARGCREACQGGHGPACHAYFRELGGAPDAGALAVLSTACKAKAAEACALLGHLKLGGGPAGLTEAVSLLDAGCAGQDLSACGSLGLLYLSGQGVKKDSPRGARLVAIACAGKYWPACSTLGQAYENGDGVPTDEARATVHYSSACLGEGGSSYPKACLTLADIYEKGYGNVPADKAQALRFYREACNRRLEAGCTAIRRLQEKDALDTPVSAGAAQVDALDRAIQPAVKQARLTLPGARQRFQAGLPRGTSFYVTTRLRDPDGTFEQVFVQVRRFEASNAATGVLSSNLTRLKNYRRGEELTVADKDILDWTIVRPDGTEEGNAVGKFLDTYQP